MEDKCFCHLAGYEVKDAKAREAIQQEAAARDQAMNAQKGVDVSEHFPLNVIQDGGEDLTGFEVLGKKFTYCPGIGVVFYRLTVKLVGAFLKTEPIYIHCFSDYSADARYEGTAAVCHPKKFNARMFNDMFTLSVDEDVEFTEDLPGIVIISGWFFSNGNHDELEGDEL